MTTSLFAVLRSQKWKDVWSFLVLVWSNCSLFPVLRLDLQILCTIDIGLKKIAILDWQIGHRVVDSSHTLMPECPYYLQLKAKWLATWVQTPKFLMWHDSQTLRVLASVRNSFQWSISCIWLFFGVGLWCSLSSSCFVQNHQPRNLS